MKLNKCTIFLISIFLTLAIAIILLAIAFENPDPEAIKREFELKNYNFLNHGSYGSTPKEVTQSREDLEHDFSATNLTDTELYAIQFEKYRSALLDLARFLEISDDKIDRLVLDHNATGSWNHILKYFLTKIIPRYENYIYWDNEETYGSMTYSTYHWFGPGTEEKIKNDKTTITVDEMYNNNLEKCWQYCQAGNKTLSIFFFDYIHSGSATVYNADKLIEISKNVRKNCPNALIVIDAAHAPGNIKHLKIEEIDADYFIGNMHKWSYSSKTASFIYAKRFDNQNFGQDFFNQVDFFEKQRKSANFESLLSVTEGIKFYNEIVGGYDNLKEHCENILPKGIEYLKKVDQGNFLDQENPVHTRTEHPITMQPVRLSPAFSNRINRPDIPGGFFRRIFIEKFKTVATWTYFENNWHIRLSCNIYNREKDYKEFADTLDQVLSTKKEDFFMHTKPTYSLKTHAVVRDTHEALKNYRHEHQNNPDKDMVMNLPRYWFSACKAISEEFIANDYPVENVGIGMEGDEDLLDAVLHTTGTTKSDFQVEYSLLAERDPSKGKYFVIVGSNEVGKNFNDQETRAAVLKSDIFITAMDGYLMGPRGSAFIAINHPDLREKYQPNIVSWNYYNTFQSRTQQQATRDYAPGYAAYDTIKNYLLAEFLFVDSFVGEKDGMFYKLNAL